MTECKEINKQAEMHTCFLDHLKTEVSQHGDPLFRTYEYNHIKISIKSFIVLRNTRVIMIVTNKLLLYNLITYVYIRKVLRNNTVRSISFSIGNYVN